MKKLIISNNDKKKLPVFCYFVGYHTMVPSDIEKKLFSYSKHTERMYGNHSSTIPISKIINIDALI